MSIPDFDRAEYNQPGVVDGNTGFIAGSPRANAAAFPVALLYGVLGALAGAFVYGAVAMTGFMVSIIAVGIGWVVARAMMTATRGFGGRQYQIASVVLTYFSCTLGSLLAALWRAHVGIGGILLDPRYLPQVLKLLLFAPLLRFMGNPFWAAMGLLILFYGLRTAWQLAAGSPGFGQPSVGGRRIRPF